MNRVLVLDAQGDPALAVVRSLGRKGVAVVAGGHHRELPAMLSKHAAGSYVHPNPHEAPEEFIDHLEAHLAANSYLAVIPITDRNRTLLSRHKERLEATGTQVAVEDWDRFQRANDKAAMIEMASNVDVPVPRTHAPESNDAIDALADDFPYPAVIKPRRTSAWDESGRYHNCRIDRENYVDTPAELRTTYRELLDSNGVYERLLPIVQEVVPGEPMATVAIADEGEPKATFQHRRLRTHPIEGGRGAVLTGVDEPRMLDLAERVIEALGWTGPIMVEFIKRPDGEFVLIEVNGRYWGAVPLPILSGIDMPWIHYLQLNGFERHGSSSYRTDVRLRQLFHTDLLWFGQKLARGEYDGVVPFLTAFATTRDTFLSARDPMPLAGALFHTARLVVGKVRG